MNRTTFLLTAAACVLAALVATAAAPSHATAKSRGCARSLNPSLKIMQPRATLRLSGVVCRRGGVRIQQRKKGSWRKIGHAGADRSGAFSACVRLRPTGKRKVHLRAVSRHGGRARATVRIAAQGGAGCELQLLKEDRATEPDPRALWGDIDAVSPSRAAWFAV